MTLFQRATIFKEWTMIICVPIILWIGFIAFIYDPLNVPVKRGFWQRLRKFIRRTGRYWNGK